MIIENAYCWTKVLKTFIKSSANIGDVLSLVVA